MFGEGHLTPMEKEEPMQLTGKLVLSALIAIVAAITTTRIQQDSFLDALLIAAFLTANLAATLIIHYLRPVASLAAIGKRSGQPSRGDRDQGTVKWFNRNKGFGFIVRDNGEEIFVHFRAIRGEGRRSLQDGQRVAFHTASSRKGPQAEDVEILDRAG